MAAVLLHLSDPHFGTEEPAVLAAVQRLAREQRPDALVLSGDVTQRARSAQFVAARAFCDSLGVPHLLALPGNHDIPLYNVAARMFAPYAGYMHAFGHDLEPELALPEALLVGVNTTRPHRHTDGEISRAQIERVARRVQGVPREVLRVAVTHQPVCVMRPQDEKDRLHGGEQAVQAWTRAGVDLVLGGHIHLPYVSDFRAHHEGADRMLYCVQAGTVCSWRVRHGTPNSLNIVRWEPPADGAPRVCRVERWDYDVADDRFEFTHRHDLPLGG